MALCTSNGIRPGADIAHAVIRVDIIGEGRASAVLVQDFGGSVGVVEGRGDRDVLDYVGVSVIANGPRPCVIYYFLFDSL